MINTLSIYRDGVRPEAMTDHLDISQTQASIATLFRLWSEFEGKPLKRIELHPSIPVWNDTTGLSDGLDRYGRADVQFLHLLEKNLYKSITKHKTCVVILYY